MLGLSPGAHTVKHAEKCMKQREEKREKAKSPSTKYRRLLLKQERATNQGANEALEGDTYQSGKFKIMLNTYITYAKYCSTYCTYVK